MNWTNESIVKATGAKVIQPATVQLHGIGTDTRQDLRGQLFIALKGDQFDAHDFLDKAVQAGAGALLIHSPTKVQIPSQVGVYLVENTLNALSSLAHEARKNSQAKYLALTGSNGKTTTKEFAAALIGMWKKTHASQGSFNNHWGVPLTLLAVQPQDEVAVIEMGMNHAGEITGLVEVADPDVVVCTTVGRAHVEHFGTIEKIAAAKNEIYDAARAEALRIFCLDNPWTKKMYEKAKTKWLRGPFFTFSAEEKAADISIQIDELRPKSMRISGHIQGIAGHADVQVFGEHNLVNLMAAASLGVASGLTPKQVWQGLERCKTSWGRNQFVKLASGAEMIFDAYNANPDSMAALVHNVARLKISGAKWGVFGQMRELGEESGPLHFELGKQAGAAGFKKVLFFGADHESFSAGVKSAQSAQVVSAPEVRANLVAEFAHQIKSGDLVVIKGSRGNKLESCVPAFSPLDWQVKTETKKN